MSEKSPQPEVRERPKPFVIVARSHFSGKNETVGTLRIKEGSNAVEFIPNSELAFPGGPKILEKDYIGTIVKSTVPGHGTVYGLDPYEKKYPINISFGFRQKYKDQDKDRNESPPEINADKGMYDQEYSKWYLSEDQWQQMHTWLQEALKQDV